MGRILALMLLVFSLSSFAKAQEATGETAEKVKKEVIQLEEERRLAILGGRDKYMAWHKRYDANEMVHVVLGTVDTKADMIAEVSSGERKMFDLKEGPQYVRVYGDGGNGTTAVTTYTSDGTTELYGKLSSNHRAAIDVWVKQGGQWWIVVHSVHPIPPERHSNQ